MSTLTTPRRTVTPPPADNPYYYGWREVEKRLPNGSVTFVKQPLTLEDCLEPQLGDHIVESWLHDFYRDYLGDVFRARTAHDPHALVLCNCGVYWDHPEFDHHAPDDAVVFGVPHPERFRQCSRRLDTFQVKEHGVKPRLIVELVSPNTRENDVEKKFVSYHALQIPTYIIIDREKPGADWKLLGYQFAPQGFLAMPTDERGRLWIDCLGIWLGVNGSEIVCYDGKTDQPIGNYVAVTQSLAESQALANAESNRAEQEKNRAEQEKNRAEQEKNRADAEAQARLAAEAKLRELEEKLARLSLNQQPDPES